MGPPRPSSFAALAHRNFRLLWTSQLISMAGSMMQNAAILWHVSLLVAPDRRGLALGMVGLVRIVPIIAFSLVSGVVADALDRRRLMLITQTGMALAAAALALVAFRGVHALWPVYLLAALGSAFGSFDSPARTSLVPTLVPREHLPNAISLNTIMFQTASVVGVSFLVVIAALLAMRDVPRRPAHETSDISWRSARAGLAFVFHTPLIRSTMLLDFFATFFASATALLPIFAQDILRVGARGYGLLSAAPSVGALLTSAALVPLLERIDRRGLAMLWSVLGYGLATVVFGLSRDFVLTFVCLALTGATDTVSMVVRNVIRQLNTPDAMRGRMTGVNMVFFMGGPQLGELEAGLVANLWGAPFSVVSGGIGCLLATLGVAAQTPALRLYRRDTPVHDAGPANSRAGNGR
ncbi:MAG: MFS transporter [Candidatus Eisenbacteria bacterium]|uniref:Multidrug efflux pump Tap n=1 Tax=Eiseniibacteriota bacterium TaxID=2212470 RepID=A0A538UAH4_UNCEI|nr:MAG: MFS transporter [Candidatus Eisenbacteria bacterium]